MQTVALYLLIHSSIIPKSIIMSKKLSLDKSTLSRLQSDQLNAATGGAADYDSTVITVDVDKAAGGDLRQAAAAGDSCCSKSCRRN